MDGSLPKLCLAVALSHQDGRHSAVALLLEAALIQVSDYRFLGASGLILPEKSFLLVYAFKETTFESATANATDIQVLHKIVA